MKEIPKHLGGHANITHLDEKVLDFFIRRPIFSFLDIGCGPGGMVELAKQYGLDARGIDGDINCANEDIIIHDYTKGPLELDVNFDLGWSVEFLEHVESKYLNNIFATFMCCSVILMTHALPGMGGYHHVNCQESNYWIDEFEKRNFLLDLDLTKYIRSISGMRRNFIRNTGMVFINPR